MGFSGNSNQEAVQLRGGSPDNPPDNEIPNQYNGFDSTNSNTNSDSSSQTSVENKEKTKQSIVFNYSSIHLTEDMDSLLNKGLNFCILSLKLDMTQVFVDLKKN